MPELLPNNDISKIVEAVRTNNLLDDDSRRLLFGHIERVRDRMPKNNVPETQLRLDLSILNKTERLKDGTLPLRVWLENALQLTAGTTSEDLFKSYVDRLEPGVPAGPPVPDPQEVPEYKEAIVHQDDMVPYFYLKDGFDAGHSVARITVPRWDNGKKSNKTYWGTGWVISSDLLITNHHVFNAREHGEPPAAVEDFRRQALESKIEFDMDDESATPQTLGVQSIEAFEAKLDACIVQLSAYSPYSALRIATQKLVVLKRDYVPRNIIQHPYGAAKRIAIRNNLATITTPDEVQYFTDTLSGSSGSPVFNDGWEVVALHRGSRAAKVSYQGRPTAVLNVGTLIHSVLGWLKTSSPQTHAKIPVGS